MKEYFVYILLCRDGSYYTGVTNDYIRRLNEHQIGVSSTAYTFKRRPVTLVYISIFRDIDQAIEWEAKIKRWSRIKKEALIAGNYEKLPDLSWSVYRKRIEWMKKSIHKRIGGVHSSTSSE